MTLHFITRLLLLSPQRLPTISQPYKTQKKSTVNVENFTNRYVFLLTKKKCNSCKELAPKKFTLF